jgi:hypothetical protein
LAEPDPVRRQELLRQWAVSVMTGDMEKTLSQIGQMQSAKIRMELRRTLLANWIQRDMPGVAAWLGTEGVEQETELRMEARALLLEALGKWEPESALTWMKASLPERDLLYEPFFRQWAGVSPAAACAKLRQLAEGGQDNPELWKNLLGQVAAQWAVADVRGAVNWVQSLPEGALKSQAMLQVSNRWTETSPQEAAAYAARQNDSELLDAVAGKWANTSPQAAAAWAAGLPDGARDGVIARLANTWAQKDPAAAATYTASLSPGAAQDQALGAVVTAWACAAPEQAAKWVSQFPESPVREIAMARLIGAWAGTKPEEAGQWLQTLPVSPSTDYALSAFSNALLEVASPEAAFEWAGDISSEPMRNAQLERVAASWLEKDAVAARKSIAQSTLPESVKKQLLANPRTE